jgi:glycosyltransferase involved in cell wall biosynthesis
MKRDFSIVCLSQGALDAPLPTNRQQVMRRAAARGHQVLFVETSPFAARTAATALRRRSIAGIFRPEDRAGNIRRLVAPNIAPRGRASSTALHVNLRLLRRSLRRAIAQLPRPVALWVYDPWTAELIGECGEDVSIYDCVDDYGSIEFYSDGARALAAEGDALAARRADVVAATTTPLYERHRRHNVHTHLVPNVADFDHFAPARDRALTAPDVAALRGPVLGFVGNLMPAKVDLELLERVADERPDWTLLLVGPATADAQATVERLARRPNVEWVGMRSYDEVPAYVAAFDVGLCPNRWNAYGASCFPLKLYEYLAAGKPVVVSGNPDLVGMEPDVRVARGAQGFIAAVELALADQSPDAVGRRAALAAENTWDSRVSRLLGLVSGALAGSAQPVLGRPHLRPVSSSSFASIEGPI